MYVLFQGNIKFIPISFYGGRCYSASSDRKSTAKLQSDIFLRVSVDFKKKECAFWV